MDLKSAVNEVIEGYEKAANARNDIPSLKNLTNKIKVEIVSPQKVLLTGMKTKRLVSLEQIGQTIVFSGSINNTVNFESKNYPAEFGAAFMSALIVIL